MSEKKNVQPPQFSLVLRVVVGGYLVYTAYELLKDGDTRPLVIAAAILFAIVGGVLCALSLRKLIRHEYFRNDPPSEDQEDSIECEGENDES